jgi:ribulose 1,5-bisphosphate carboxylase large subunit-like protein
MGGDAIAVGTMGGVGKMVQEPGGPEAVAEAITTVGTTAGPYMGAQLPARWGDLKPAMPIVSGGLDPFTMWYLIRYHGINDALLQAGGGLHGHPGGTAAGATAMRQAVDLAMGGKNIFEWAAKPGYEELKVALETWPHADLVARMKSEMPVPLPPPHGAKSAGKK